MLGFIKKFFIGNKTESIIPSMQELNSAVNSPNNQTLPPTLEEFTIGKSIKNFLVGVVAQPCKTVYHGVATAYYGIAAKAENIFWGTKTRQEPLNNHLGKFKHSALATFTLGISTFFSQDSKTTNNIVLTTSEKQLAALSNSTKAGNAQERTLSPIEKHIIDQAKKEGEKLSATPKESNQSNSTDKKKKPSKKPIINKRT